jgi:hypothetical protein
MSLSSRTKLWNFLTCLFEHELSETSSQYAQPAWVKTPLLEHQRAAIQGALDLESHKTGKMVGPVPGYDDSARLYTSYGILGDSVGSGKSLIALSLVKCPLPSSNILEFSTRPGTNNGYTMGILRERERSKTLGGDTLQYTDAALFIIPHPLMGQWEEYIKKDTTLRAMVIKKRKDATDPDMIAKINRHDCVLVSSTMWREFDANANIHTVAWSRVFIDEADTIVLSTNDERIHTRFVWLITASWIRLFFSNSCNLNLRHYLEPPPSTPFNTIQRMKRFTAGDFLTVSGPRSVFVRRICGDVAVHSYSVGVLNAAMFQSTRLLVHSSEEFIAKSFRKPTIAHSRILCLTPPNIQVLRQVVSEDMMERLHAGDTDGLLEMLGMQTHTADQVVDAVCESIEKELRNVRLTYEYKKSMEYSSESAKVKALEQVETRIGRLESRISAIKERLAGIAEQTCPICFCEVQSPALTPCCRNLFCLACICDVLRRNYTGVCPLCREIIPNIQSLQVIGASAAAAAQDVPKLLSKQEQFRKILADNPAAKILMFSSYDATFSYLEEVLEVDGIPHATLNGSQARIAKLIREFGEGKYRVLFLNSKNMGSGLNILAATHVILYHKMSVETQDQIIGRAMRMGRTEPLTVIHLLHGNEMTTEAAGSGNDAESDDEIAIATQASVATHDIPDTDTDTDADSDDASDDDSDDA